MISHKIYVGEKIKIILILFLSSFHENISWVLIGIISERILLLFFHQTYIVSSHWNHLNEAVLALVLLNLDIPCLCKQCRSRSIGF